MTLLKRTISNPSLWVYIFSFILHFALFNVNVAEWGDSYHILRAAEFLRSGTYPLDEKRPPLYSALLAVRPSGIDPVIWGRSEMLVLSLISLFVFRRLAKVYIKDQKYIDLSSLFFVLNPVYLYWSLRIMADALLSLFAMTAFIIHGRFLSTRKPSYLLFLGLITGMAILTRFEGYLLFGAFISSFMLNENSIVSFKFKELFKEAQKNFKYILLYTITVLFVILPYIILRNPFASTYFSEPSGRTYDLRMVWVYVVSLMFIFGSLPLSQIVLQRWHDLKILLKGSYALAVFMCLELFLILVWPAAIPRLFVAILPYILIFGTVSLQNYMHAKTKLSTIDFITTSLSVLGVFIFSQYVLRLQFLITSKYIFATIFFIQVLTYIVQYFKKYRMFVSLILVSMGMWAVTVILMHKDIYVWSKHAAEYVSENLNGTVVYNDVNSVSRWYLEARPNRNLQIKPVYLNTKYAYNLNLPNLQTLNADYIILTDEDSQVELELVKRLPYLELDKEFSYNVNGREFTSAVFKVMKGYE